MQKVSFEASGHQNIVGEHKTTVELTSEDTLTKRGTCIVGVRTSLTLAEFSKELKHLAAMEATKIVLRMRVGEVSEEVTGRGDPRLTYDDAVSMVARRSTFVCGRTLMVGADKAASDLSREFISMLRDPARTIDCEIEFTTE